MPTRRSRCTKSEDQTFRRRLSELGELGIVTRHAEGPSPEPEELIFEQTHGELAYIYELSLHDVAVVVPAKMSVPKSGIVITDSEILTPWDDYPLDLSDLEEWSFHQHVIGRLYHRPPRLLNPWLTGKVPLSRGQVEGVIIAYRCASLPVQCPQDWPVTVELALELLRRDEGRKKLFFNFSVQVDPSAKHECLQRHRERLAIFRSNERSGLFGPNRGQPGVQKSVSPERTIKQPPASGEHVATRDVRTPKPN